MWIEAFADTSMTPSLLLIFFPASVIICFKTFGLEDFMSDQNSSVELIKKRYEEAIAYYKNSSRKNKNWYRRTTLIAVVLSAFVTLLSSLSSSKALENWPTLIFVIGVPVTSFILTVIAGLTQIFHWGPAWRDMTLAQLKLQAAYDKFKTTDPKNVDCAKESEFLNSFIISESEEFFERMLSSKPSDNDNS